MSSKEKKRSWKKRTIAMSSNGSGPSGIGVPSASPIASLRHVDPRGDGQRHRAREAGVDLQQGGLAGGVELDLHVGDGGQADQAGDVAGEAFEARRRAACGP